MLTLNKVDWNSPSPFPRGRHCGPDRDGATDTPPRSRNRESTEGNPPVVAGRERDHPDLEIQGLPSGPAFHQPGRQARGVHEPPPGHLQLVGDGSAYAEYPRQGRPHEPRLRAREEDRRPLGEAEDPIEGPTAGSNEREDEGEGGVRDIEFVSQDEFLVQLRLRKDRGRDHLEEEQEGHELGEQAEDEGNGPEKFEEAEEDREGGATGPSRPLHEADRLLEILHLRPSMGEEDGAQGTASDERGQIGKGQESHRVPTTLYHPR